MLGSRMPTRCNVLKTSVGRENFAAIAQTLRAATMGITSDSSCDKENICSGENRKISPTKANAGFTPGNVLKDGFTNGQVKVDCSSKVANTAEIIKQMLNTEEHHVIELIEDKQGNVKDVVWCPVYVRADLKGRARGADEIPHHKCKTCGGIGLHLLNDGQKYRPCLRCAGWSEAEIPTWYYHLTCRHCGHVLNH